MPAAPRSASLVSSPSGAASGRAVSTLSADLNFQGDVAGAGDLQVDGHIKGDLQVGRLVVGETGAVEGAIRADFVEVRGRIVGSVQAKQIKLLATAYVDGDLTADQLSIDVGAFFQERGAQSQRKASPLSPDTVVHATPTAVLSAPANS
ncbi:hypothetical protein LTR94_029021 [Friedmanniomyces endolithicus]|nr:hypothetical protein LTR94_029021 [Friedmanniomyces endolithicus]